MASSDPHLIYHFVHLDTLPGILASGALWSTNELARRGVEPVRSIANEGIQDRRAWWPVPMGGVVHDYVPFYFAPRSPMLFRIGAEWDQDPDESRHAHDLVYLVSSAETVAGAGLPFTFSTYHAVTKPNRFFPSDDAPGLAGLSQIDWPLMRARMWRDTDDDNDRKRRRQAEFLVRDQIPLEAMLGFATHDQERAARVTALVHEHGVSVQGKPMPDWYF